jgi:HSP20 family protein
MSRQTTSLLLLTRLQEEVNRLFSDFCELGESALEEGEWSPRVDVLESGASIVLLAEAPGLRAADLQVEVMGNLVILSGTKHIESGKAKRSKVHRLERRNGPFLRRISLLRPVNGLLARAELAAGVLTITLPKIEEQRERTHPIPIEVRGETA